MKFCVFLIFVSILSQAKLNNYGNYPEYFEIHSSDSEFHEFGGFYRKTDQQIAEIHVYKKPRIQNYLYNRNGQWMIGNTLNVELIDGYIFLNDTSCDLPNSSLCSINFTSFTNHKILKINITSHSGPTYPEYYEVNGDAKDYTQNPSAFGFYKRKDVYKNFPYYINPTSKYALFLHNNGQWTIDIDANFAGEGHYRSRPNAIPWLQDIGLWEFWKGTNWENSSTISVTPLVYPQEYYITYDGDDHKVRELFEEKKITGTYEKQTIPHNGLPYYDKTGPPTLHLFKNDQNSWTVSPYLHNIQDKLIYQDRQMDPAPMENEPWHVRIDNAYNPYPGIMISKVGELAERFGGINFPDSTSYETEKENKPANMATDEKKEINPEKEKDNNMILMVSIPISLSVVAIAALTAVFLLKRKRHVEEPKIDDNMYYGQDDEYYDEQDNCVTDNNDYYE